VSDAMVSSRKWMGYHRLQPVGNAKNLDQSQFIFS